MSENSGQKDLPPGLWAGQALHAICLAVLLILLWRCWFLLGQRLPFFFWAAAAMPVLHQVYVWLTWRLELNSSAVSKAMGFQAYLIGFFGLFGARFVLLVGLAWMDYGSLGLGPSVQVLLTVICGLPGLYAMYSVRRYFGMARAAGADHFDASYRSMPLVKQGIFKFTDNGMYFYAFLLFWAIAFGFNSAAAVAVAAFSHAYIWVHYYATEKIDMAYLYRQ
ncbi:MAG: methyltransferase [Rhizobiaceae bacterium]